MDEIGRLLRAAREARGETIADIESETKIRGRYIQALEAGTPELLPGEVFIKGFLRTYANYLGLDGPELVERYKALSGRPATFHTAATGPRPAPKAVPAAADSAPTVVPAPSVPAAPTVQVPPPPLSVPTLLSHSAAPAAGAKAAAPRTPVPVRAAAANHYPAATRRPARFSPAIFWGAGLLILAVVLGVWLVRSGNRPGTLPPPAPAAGQPTTPAPSPAPAPTPAPAPPPPPAVKVEKGSLKVIAGNTTLPVTISNAAEITFNASALDRCWLRVVADGKTAPLFEGTLNPGETLQWKAASRLEIIAGYPKGLAATINGQTFSPVDGSNNPIWLDINLVK